ncbi:O-antigen ligase family protein [Vibrio sp. TRT 17S01]|uniref:O-antigen ligase family protein n=1 Tax=Vibrio sp. TRT 17S01 TaxID=3418505 RepID=UPI003CF89D63
MDKVDKVCFHTLLLLLVWLPVPLGSNRVWAWSIFGTIISGVVIAFVISSLVTKRELPFNRLIRFGWLLVPLMLYLCWGIFQLIPLPMYILDFLSPNAYKFYSQFGLSFSPITLDPYATKVALLKGVYFLLFVISTILFVNTPNRIKKVLFALLLSGLFQGAYGAFEILSGAEHSLIFQLKVNKAATGSFVYKNHFANYLVMCLCMGLALIVANLHSTSSGSWFVRFKRWVGAILSGKMLVRLAMVVMVIALVMSRSRMGNTAFFVASCIGGIVALLFYKQKPRALVALIISVLMIDAIVVGSLFGVSKVQQRIAETSFTQETRDEVVEWSLPIISDFPLTGTGMGSFYSVFPAYSKYNIGFYDHAHNDYLQFAVEAGIPATLLLGFPCLWALWLCVKSMRTRNSRTLKGTALGCFMAILAMLIHISVDFMLQAPANAVTFLTILVLAGCSASMKISRRSEKDYV